MGVDRGQENRITPAHTIAELEERLRILVGINPYQRQFYRFLTELVWTVDEASGGRVARFPADPYVREVCDGLIEEPLTFWEKSRRVRMTWIVSAFDLWVAAGGQDPRWRASMGGTGNRTILIISKKKEDAAWVLNERIKPIYYELERRDIRKKWPSFPYFRFPRSVRGAVATASNGSIIRALPQGERQVRQYAATIVHYEEVAHSEDARSTIAAALPTMLGPGGISGHIILICTPQAGSFAADLRSGLV